MLWGPYLMGPLTLHAALSPVHRCPLLAAGLLLPQVSAAGQWISCVLIPTQV